MTFTTANLLVLAALAASIVLLVQHRERLFPGMAVLASGVETLIALDLLQLKVKGVSLALVLGGVLAAAAIVVWVRGAGKAVVTASTVAALVGALQVVAALKLV